MVKITEELLRKRSEHNDGCLSTLKEITLHQFDIEKIELVGNLCRELQILYLQNNLIKKIENLHHLKDLQYLNLAVNNIEWIEGLEGCESLKKLDLTLNFVEDMVCIENLTSNYNLEELYLIGNPCTNFEGYRDFVINSLPQLKKLDGEDIKKSERIKALKKREDLADRVRKQHEMIKDKKKKKSQKEQVFDREGNKLYDHSPESRKEIAFHLNQLKDEAGMKDRAVDGSKIGEIDRLGQKNNKSKGLTVEEEIEKYGRVMQKNEGKWDFKMCEDDEHIILEIPCGKYLSSAHIDVEVQPTYVRILIKGKLLQLRLPEEVKSSEVIAQRSTITGNLKLIMKKINPNDLVIKKSSKQTAVASHQTTTDTLLL